MMGEPSNPERPTVQPGPLAQERANEYARGLGYPEPYPAGPLEGYETFHDVGRDLRAERKAGLEHQGDGPEIGHGYRAQWLEAADAYNHAMESAFTEYRRAVEAGWELYRAAKQTAELDYERARIAADAAWSSRVAEIRPDHG